MLSVRLFAVILLALVSIPGLFSQDSTVTMAYSLIPPYSERNLPGQGLLIALNRAAYDSVGWTLKLREVPAARVFMEAKEGLVDGFFMGSEGSTAQGFLWSRSVLESEIVVAVREDSPHRSSRRDILINLRLGIVRGYGLESAYPDFSFETAVDPLGNFRKLLAGRVDGIMEERFSLTYLIRKEGSPEAFRVRILVPPLRKMNFVSGFTLKDPRAGEKRDALNRGLEIIRENGTFAQILKQYSR